MGSTILLTVNVTLTCAIIMTELLTWKLSSVRFVLFSRRKRGTVHKNCSYFKLTRIQNSYYCENLLLDTYKLVFTITRAHGYPDSHSYQCECSLLLLSIHCLWHMYILAIHSTYSRVFLRRQDFSIEAVSEISRFPYFRGVHMGVF